MIQVPDQPSGWPIFGHEHAVLMLRRSLRTGQLAHAYLFAGSEGVGKRTLALLFAMSINCQGEMAAGNIYPDVPCLLCSSCARIARMAHPDVMEMNLETQAQGDGQSRGKSGPAKELRIDAIRGMLENVGLSPHSGRSKVYIIGDADRLNEEASNCMLKTLEEPPSHTVLILLASDERAVLPTISSRCLAVPLRTLPRSVVEHALIDLDGVEADKASTWAALSGGRIGWALTNTLDRAMADRRRAALEEMSVLAGATAADRINAATRYAKMFTDARSDLYAMLDAWEGWWRDVLVVKAGAPELVSNSDQVPALTSIASRVLAGRASGAVQLIGLTRQQLMENVNPRLALEALALGLP